MSGVEGREWGRGPVRPAAAPGSSWRCSECSHRFSWLCLKQLRPPVNTNRKIVTYAQGAVLRFVIGRQGMQEVKLFSSYINKTAKSQFHICFFFFFFWLQIGSCWSSCHGSFPLEPSMLTIHAPRGTRYNWIGESSFAYTPDKSNCR